MVSINNNGKTGVFTVTGQKVKTVERIEPKKPFKVLELSGTVTWINDDGELSRDIKVTGTVDDGPLFMSTNRRGGEFISKDGVLYKLMTEGLKIWDTQNLVGKTLPVKNTGYWNIDLQNVLENSKAPDPLTESVETDNEAVEA